MEHEHETYRDAIEAAVRMKGRTRWERRRMRQALRAKFAAQLAVEDAESRRLPKRFRLRCCAMTRAGRPCVRLPVEGKRRCRNHGGCSTGPRTKAGRRRIAAAQRARWARWREERGRV
jgi:hypothetical protein